MMEVFLDASVLFSAAYSQTGASRELIRLGIRGEVKLVISDLVYREAKRNLETKAPEAASEIDAFRREVPFKIVKPSVEEIQAAMKYTAAKDAPVVAAAKTAQVDYLVSLDRSHLAGVSAVEEGSGLRIVLPGDLLKSMRED
jgi:predicted nucleic acid-binding protein